MLHFTKEKNKNITKKNKSKIKSRPIIVSVAKQFNYIFIWEKKKNTKWSSRENIKNQDKEVEAKYK